MTELYPGDRVRLSPHARPDRRGAIGDMQGTVVSRNPWGPQVQWDIPTPRWDGPDADEVELVPVSEQVNAPVDPDTQAFREHLLELAIKAVDFSADAATVVATAQAFEAYITGGTK